MAMLLAVRCIPGGGEHGLAKFCGKSNWQILMGAGILGLITMRWENSYSNNPTHSPRDIKRITAPAAVLLHTPIFHTKSVQTCIITIMSWKMRSRLGAMTMLVTRALPRSRRAYFATSPTVHQVAFKEATNFFLAWMPHTCTAGRDTVQLLECSRKNYGKEKWSGKTTGMNYVRTLLDTGVKTLSNTFCRLGDKELDLWPQINKCLFVNCWVQGDTCPESEDIPSKHSWNILLKSRKWMNGGIIIWSFCHLLSSPLLKRPSSTHSSPLKWLFPIFPPATLLKFSAFPSSLSLFFFFFIFGKLCMLFLSHSSSIFFSLPPLFTLAHFNNLFRPSTPFTPTLSPALSSSPSILPLPRSVSPAG